MRELFGEIVDSLSRNKLRTLLTGFSVAWGIFMLIMLIGSGNGLKHGILSNFEGAGMTTNSVYIQPNTTSIPYAGYAKGRRLKFDREIIDFIGSDFSQVEQVAPLLNREGRLRYGNIFNRASIKGVAPVYAQLTGLRVIRGRNISQSDIELRRNVVVLDQVAVKTLFGKHEPIGQSVTIDNIIYDVVGVIKPQFSGSQPVCYIPLSTFMKLYVRDDKFDNIHAVINGVTTLAQADELNKGLREGLSKKLNFAPKDRRAVLISNNVENYMQFMMIFTGISIFIWIIGVGTLMAGVVGVSNIMLVTVKDRTSEFGIRKALGAKPSSLIRLVIMESIVITVVFGYIGMICGVGVMEVVNMVIERNIALSSDQMVIFKNPTLDISVTISATITLIIAGVVAGYIPARRAAKIKTIDAMRHNK